MKLFLIVYFLALLLAAYAIETSLEEEKYGVKYATDCEVCKLVTKEVEEKLLEKHSSDVIETGYNMDAKKKKTKYNLSELRLLEVLESVCEGMLDYRVHKERKDSTRWAKTMSQTFRTLHGLVNKGVKVDLGIPFELWDDPSAEVAHLKTQCEQFLETNEDTINSWYFSQKNLNQGLQQTVCGEILSRKDAVCLTEPYGETIKSSPDDKEKDSKASLKTKNRAALKGDTTKNEL